MTVRAWTRLRDALPLVALLLAVVEAPAVARAQDAPAATAEPAPPVPAGSDDEDPAWDLFRDAFVAEVDGHPTAALERLRELRARFPDHAATRLAASVYERLLSRRPEEPWAPPVEPSPRPAFAPPLPDAPRAGGRERPTGLARAELVGFQTLHGIGLGLETCLAFDCDDVRASVAVVSVTGGLGLGLSLGLTGGGVEPGYALLLNSGTLWGFWNGLALYGVAEGLDDAERRDWVPAAGVGQAIGLGGGLLLWQLTRPRAGQVSMANSVGMWAGVIGLLSMGAADFDLPERTGFLVLALASDFGLLGGAILADFVTMPRGRALVIDAGGIVGMLGGMGVAVLAGGDDVRPAGFFLPALLGTLTGLSLTTFFTRGWSDDQAGAPDVRAGLVPVEGGGAVLTLAATR